MIKFGAVQILNINERGLIAAMRSAKSRAYARRIGIEKTEKARSLAPVDTGRLRDSINYVVIPDETIGWQVVVYAATDYAVYVEYGTVRSPAQPFLRPALYSRFGSSGLTAPIAEFEIE